MIIGIDVSKEKIDCAWLRDIETGKVKTKVLKNKPAGFKSLIDWAVLNTKQPIEKIHFVMEATGIYHEALAYALHGAGATVSVVNPAYIHDYGKAWDHARRRIKKTASSLLVMARLNIQIPGTLNQAKYDT